MNTQQDYDLFLERCNIVEGTLPTLEELNGYGVKIIHEVNPTTRTYQVDLDEPFLDKVDSILSIKNTRTVCPVELKDTGLAFKVYAVLK